MKKAKAVFANGTSLNSLHYGNGKAGITIDATTGEMVSLELDGREMLGCGMPMGYTNHRWIENDRFAQTTDGMEEKAEIKIEGFTYGGKAQSQPVVITTLRRGSLCDTRIVYTLHAEGSIDIDATFTPHTADLRRAGLQVGLNRQLQHVDYYAYGPLENYNDRHVAHAGLLDRHLREGDAGAVRRKRRRLEDRVHLLLGVGREFLLRRPHAGDHRLELSDPVIHHGHRTLLCAFHHVPAFLFVHVPGKPLPAATTQV